MSTYLLRKALITVPKRSIYSKARMLKGYDPAKADMYNQVLINKFYQDPNS